MLNVVCYAYSEEGARFPKSMVSSGVWSGAVSLEDAWSLQEVGPENTATVKSELQRIGYLGPLAASHTAMPLGAHFELHIEQGPGLEQSGKIVGVVEGIQAYRWYTITVKGREAHTGTTPFPSRSDALLAAARMIVKSNEIASWWNGLASTGILNVTPGSVNVIPGKVTFSLDVRHKDDGTLAKIVQSMKQEFHEIANNANGTNQDQRECEVEWRWDTDSPRLALTKNALTQLMLPQRTSLEKRRCKEWLVG
ncbi:hypothetical protein RUND412_010292 [Rhizina undulata]